MNPANPWLLHAEQLLNQRHLPAALACFDLAQRKGAEPDRCAAGRWMIWMLQGKFEEAWRESDAILRRGAPTPHRFWNGESIRGKRVIVRCLHGFGDAVQFLRYMPALQSIASRVILEVPPRMLSLARCIRGVDEVITWGEAAPPQPPAWDVQIEVTELPYFFRTRQRDLPVATRYLRLPQQAQRSAAAAIRSPESIHAGVVWSSGEWNLTRSIPLADLRPLFEDPAVTFWNLQGGEVRDQWRELGSALNLRDTPALCADAGLVPLAAIISRLDLVITVDTLAAHLAGALGRPAWLLLPIGAWSKTGPFDVKVVTTSTYPAAVGYGFGSQTLRISDAITSGSFGDQTFSPGLADEAGETGASDVGSDGVPLSGGLRQSHFDASFLIGTTQSIQQCSTCPTPLKMTVSPDRGDGARMSFLRFEDQADGVHVFFVDVTDPGRVPNGDTFNTTDIATLDRAHSHLIRFSIDFKDGPANDQVKIYIDGALKKTGTTWEDYYRYDSEQASQGNQVPTVDKLLFRESGNGSHIPPYDPNPSDLGQGFLLDRVILASSGNNK